jgi:histidine phosphotransfer protein HptB
MKEKIITHLDPDLRDLIPSYLRNRENDIKTIIKSIETTGFDKIHILAHSMRGSGGSYGFMSANKINDTLEEASRIKDLKQI